MDDSSHTFVVCAYGSSAYLSECVESVVSQSSVSRVVIATSTPNDHIDAVAKKWDVEVKVNSVSGGIASDWNFALSCVDTPLATIAHQDDVYLPEYSEHVVKAANKADDLIIFFSNYGEIRDQGRIEDDNSLLRVKRTMLRPMKDGRMKKFKRARRAVLSFGSAICCPSVAFNLGKIQQPIFSGEMKSNLDWQAWERLSKDDGSFYYDSTLLMRHRIHGDSETTHLIRDNTRAKEDFRMLCLFWPKPVARFIYKFYARGQNSNSGKGVVS